jgi:hypothetical protein
MHLSGSQPCEYALTAERVLGNGLAFRVIHKMHAAELTWRYFCNCYERTAIKLALQISHFSAAVLWYSDSVSTFSRPQKTTS